MLANMQTTNLSSKGALTSSRPMLPAQPRLPARSASKIVAMAKNPLQKTFKSKVSYDKNSYETNPVQSAFTRRREIFVGRTAMTGFFTCVIGELITGKGAIGQLNLETSVPPFALKAGLLAIVGFNLVTALLPNATFSDENQKDVRKRPAGGVQKPGKKNLIEDPQGTLGISKSGFGFTKKNELFVGRVAMLGFAAELIGEELTGKGPLAQIGIPLGQPLNKEIAGAALFLWIGFFAVAAIGAGNLGQQTGNEEVY